MTNKSKRHKQGEMGEGVKGMKAWQRDKVVKGKKK